MNIADHAGSMNGVVMHEMVAAMGGSMAVLHMGKAH
jgi:hypothetical protein